MNMVQSIAILSCLLIFLSCGDKGTESDEGTGVLQFDLTYGNSSMALMHRNVQNTCKIIDVRSIIYEIAVSTGRVTPGAVNDLAWESIYTSSEEKLGSQINFPPVALPSGEYKSIKIAMRNGIYWRCVTLAGDTVELRDMNCTDSAFNALSPINFFSDTGLCYINPQNTFFLQTSDEKMGGFDISNNDTTSLTLRQNFNTLDWFDKDSSSTWTTGDSLANWTIISGTTTMCDFIVGH